MCPSFSFVCFSVPIELNWVLCVLFGRHFNFLNINVMNHHLRIHVYFLELGIVCIISYR